MSYRLKDGLSLCGGFHVNSVKSGGVIARAKAAALDRDAQCAARILVNGRVEGIHGRSYDVTIYGEALGSVR